MTLGAGCGATFLAARLHEPVWLDDSSTRSTVHTLLAREQHSIRTISEEYR